MADETKPRTAPVHDVVTVELLGAGEDAREVVHVPPGDGGPAWDLVRLTGRGDVELRIPDGQLATWLEFADARKIRALIKRHERAGNIKPFRNVHTVARFAADGSPRGEVRVVEFLLTEEDALFIATQSETKKAVAVTKTMIRVFALARRGLLPSQQPVDVEAIVKRAVGEALATFAPTTKAVEVVQADVADLKVAGAAVVLSGRYRAEVIRQRVAEAVALMVKLDATRSPAGHTTAIHMHLRGAVGLGVTGCSWDRAPLATWEQALSVLAGLTKMLRRLAQPKGGRPRQLSIPLPPSN